MFKHFLYTSITFLFGCISLMAQQVPSAAAREAADSVWIQLGVSAESDTLFAGTADSLRLVQASFWQDSLKREMRQRDSLEQLRILNKVLWVSWQAYAAAHPLPDTFVVQPPVVPEPSKRRSRRPAPPRRTFADCLDSLRHVVDSLPFDPMLTYAQLDYRMPVIIDPRGPHSWLRRMDVGRSRKQAPAWEIPSAVRSFEQQREVARARQRSVQNYFIAHPFAVQYLRTRMVRAPQKEKLSVERTLEGSRIDVVDYNIEYAPLLTDKVHADKWHYRGFTSLQMTQTAMSENWYKGGENNMTLYSDHKLEIKRYDENKLTTFETVMQVKLGLYYTASDTIHPTRVNDNQFLLDVKYGYKAWKKWYYSTQMTFKTPLFNLYSANSHKVKSAFLSPAELNVSVGMDFKFENKKKTFSYSLMLAPLSYNLKYVHHEKVDVTKYGIERDHRSLNQLGASLTNKLEWKITKDISWASRLYAFTSYESVLGEFENTFTFRVNRYFSAKIMFYPRFDDHTDSRVWQMKEMLTFGFNYIW